MPYTLDSSLLLPFLCLALSFHMYSCNKKGNKTVSADNSLSLIISNVIAKLMLLLPFSSWETYVLLDLRRTEDAGFLPFFSVHKLWFGNLEEEWRDAERFVKRGDNEWTLKYGALVKMPCVNLRYAKRNSWGLHRQY